MSCRRLCCKDASTPGLNRPLFADFYYPVLSFMLRNTVWSVGVFVDERISSSTVITVDKEDEEPGRSARVSIADVSVTHCVSFSSRSFLLCYAVSFSEPPCSREPREQRENCYTIVIDFFLPARRRGLVEKFFF